MRSSNDRSAGPATDHVSLPAGPTLLAFEGSERDMMLLKCATAACNASYHLEAFSESESAKEFLMGRRLAGNGPGLPEPALALLDCSSAEGSCIELVQWMRGVPAHTNLVAVVFGPDDKGGVIERCYGAGANYYLAKPATYERLKQVMLKLDNCLNLIPACFDSLVHLPEYREARKGYAAAGICQG